MAAEEDELTTAWRKLCRDFFPDWDPAGWSIRVDRGISGDGLCRRTAGGGGEILIKPVKDPVEQTVVKLHETCHARSRTDGHGPEWLGRMRQAAARAEALGQDE